MIALTWRAIDTPTARAFKISAGTMTSARSVIVEARDDEGRVGYGEATPSARVTGESEESIAKFLEWARGEVKDIDPDDPRPFLAEMATNICGNAGARCGVDLALHDLWGKRAGKPARALHGIGDGAIEMPLTVSMDLPETMAREAKEYFARGFDVLKVKLGQARNDEPRIAAVRRAVPQARLRVDANEGWSREEARRLAPVLFRHGVEFMEQPLARNDLTGLAELSRTSEVPVVVDESVADATDVARLVDHRFAGGVNVKLQKAGGLKPALDAILAARAAGFGTQVGCNVETGVGIAGAAQLIPLLDWADLDGNLLLARDPFEGVRGERGRIAVPAAPGLGVRPS
ncbi:MAG TPA: dipeptide epimerase [Candidatus Thermoplasmatota archaeon]|nr:dipeptide epimerase [Candidatus Thermoplasmatota archaeon]